MKNTITTGLCILLILGLSAQPNSAIKLVEKAKEHMRKGTLVEATVQLTQAISEYENYPEAYELRAMSFQGMGKMEQAKEDYAMAIQFDPGRIISLVRLIDLYKSDENWKRVQIYARIIMEKHPDNACPATFDFAQATYKVGLKEDARDAYESFLGRKCEGMEKQKAMAKARVKEWEE